MAPFNHTDAVRNQIAPRAETLADVRTQLSGLGDDDLRTAILALRGPMQQYGVRAARPQRQGVARRMCRSIAARPSEQVL